MLTLLLPLVGCAAAATIPTVEIAPGVHMPQISLGTCCGSEPKVGLKPWFATGARGVDTANDYSDQADIAAVMHAPGAPPRGEVFITTKLPAGLDVSKSCVNGTAGAAIALNYVKQNLQQLRTDYVDLTVLHKPCPHDAENQALWQGLEEALAQNLTRAIGISNFVIPDIEALLTTAKVKPAINQCELNLKTHDDATIAYCQKQGIAYEAFFAMRFCPFTSPTLQGIAAAHNKTTAQVCLRYIADRGALMAVGTGNNASTVGEYAQENIGIFDFKLSATEMSQLEHL